jgi:hypothetical protein
LAAAPIVFLFLKTRLLPKHHPEGSFVGSFAGSFAGCGDSSVSFGVPVRFADHPGFAGFRPHFFGVLHWNLV